MKSPKTPFLEAVAGLTAAGREALAAEIFGLETVRLAIVARANEGYDQLVIRPPRAVDLRPTAAAKALLAHLAKEGLRVGWETYTLVDGPRPEQGLELHIAWT